MKNIKITFFKTETRQYPSYSLGVSKGEKLSIEVSYNTDNFKRALSCASKKVQRMKRENHELIGLNHTIEFI